MHNITLCCVTFNESSRIYDFIKYHQPYFNEIIILDTQSTDNTLQICKDLGVTTIVDKNRGLAEPCRHIAALHATNQWLLFLDADEYLSDKILPVLGNLINNDKNVDGYLLERSNYIDNVLIDKEITQYRLFKKQNVVFNWFLHGGIEPLSYSNVATMYNAIIHKKSNNEHSIDNNVYSSIILNSPENISPFWYLQYQTNVFPIESLITFIVTTSAKHSNPDITHVQKMFESYDSYFGASSIRKILVADGFHKSRNLNNLTYDNLFGPVSEENYQQYKANLREWCPSANIELMELPENKYMNGALLEATTRTSTPYYMFSPDDIVAKRPVDLLKVIREMAKDLSVKKLNFHNYSLVTDSFNWKLERGNNPSFPYLKTSCWSANTHIGYTHHYNYCYGHVIRQIGQYPFERVMHEKYNNLINTVGFDQAYRVYGCAIYGNYGDERYVDHDFSYLDSGKNE